jgi:hypothetical protein
MKQLLRILVLAAALVALEAVSAVDAMAAPETRTSWWYVGGTALTAGSPETIKCSKTGAADIEIGGTSLQIHATGVECLSATIENKLISSSKMGLGAVTLKFTGVTVTQPAGAGCKTASSFSTNAISTNLELESANKTESYLRFVPASGDTFATIKFDSCAAAGTYPWKGIFYGGWVNSIGVFAVTQQMTLEPFMGVTTFGGKAAHISGDAKFEVGSGNSWGLKET